MSFSRFVRAKTQNGPESQRISGNKPKQDLTGTDVQENFGGRYGGGRDVDVAVV